MGRQGRADTRRQGTELQGAIYWLYPTWKQLSSKTKMKAPFAVPVASSVLLLLLLQGILLDMLESNE
eukprot:100858-Pyramimonas_sp.AAC.1